ncbi:MAG: isoprenylcysteine carboxylmethyltransferase family protein [Anaerolineaceae bacterium]|nr:isoprenylcysteine carboxylmethyltransferase family protein [Anaerolineaceae bacterium]
MQNNSLQTGQQANPQKPEFTIWKIIPGIIISILMPTLCLIMISGNWNWWEGWTLILVTSLITVAGRYILIRKHPGLANERANYKEKEGTQEWDKKLMPLIAIYGPIAVWAVAGLDKRFSLSTVLPPEIEIAAFLIITIAYLFSTWAMLENQFFAAIVRIQHDRDHKVIDSGPYAIVRHPGYAGSFIASLFIPLALSTFWVYIPVLLANLIVFVRTAKEDQFLQAELPGYADYTQKTRYRLIPGIW